ncbi:hypothetical protein HMPREF9709_01791 [Helcococcus kunzii ATCC 51366]|uniref:Nudix hydrolase domain-containing protein n=1 Tax=Helcococcus kunzii ATCC 51366 TaxID=883114 RepID=H3NR30_9FIRM|nr:GrpB family protein [Helcococcus kunzii]EHR31978.1 hypothetical protein HMPREF9709_01791 [Helcococcus kunzii ATCC 51366]
MGRQIILHEYNPEWVDRYNQIERDICKIFGNEVINVQHFGSTSIKGMKSKDTVDVLVIVKDISNIDAYNKKMKSKGYIAKGENGISGRRYFQQYDSNGVDHLAHIHVYSKENKKVSEELKFRDYLRSDEVAFNKYLNIKEEASKLYSHSPKKYQEYKSKTIKELLNQADEYFKKSERFNIDAGFLKEKTWFRYRAAAIIVEDKKVLLAKNNITDYYYSVGGAVHVGETSEKAVIREVFEETGEVYEIDRLAVIHENIYWGIDPGFEDVICHEICFYYIMKPKGLLEFNQTGMSASGVEEKVYWLDIENLNNVKAYPSFIKKYLNEETNGFVHFVEDRTGLNG